MILKKDHTCCQRRTAACTRFAAYVTSVMVPSCHSERHSPRFATRRTGFRQGALPREMQFVHAVSKGITPTQPSGALIAECRWTFIQRCWSTVDITRTHPSGEGTVDFTENELPRPASAHCNARGRCFAGKYRIFFELLIRGVVHG